MQIEYIDKIEKTNKELIKIKNKIKSMQNSKNSIKKLDNINVYKNYAVIVAYGCLENITKNIIADYYKNINMPLRCQTFANNLLSDNYSLSIKKELIYRFIKKECSVQWFDEIKRREFENIKDKKYKKFTMQQIFVSTDFIFAERCKFAHGESSYSGTINELIDNFKRAKAWLYELDSIVNNKKFKG